MGQPLPGALRMAVPIIALEAAAIAGVTGFLVYEDIVAAATSVPGALFVTVCAALTTVTLVALARALSRRRGGARGPAVVFQLMLMPVGYYMAKGDLPWLGVPLMALGVAVCGLLVAPSSTRALGLDGPRRVG